MKASCPPAENVNEIPANLRQYLSMLEHVWAILILEIHLAKSVESFHVQRFLNILLPS